MYKKYNYKVLRQILVIIYNTKIFSLNLVIKY